MNTPGNSDATAAATAMASEPTLNHQQKADSMNTVNPANPYPVDSRYFPCCHAIGGHSPACASWSTEIAYQHVDLAERTITFALDQIHDDATLFATVDLVMAGRHLREAARLIDRATISICREDTDDEVTR